MLRKPPLLPQRVGLSLAYSHTSRSSQYQSAHNERYVKLAYKTPLYEGRTIGAVRPPAHTSFLQLL